MRSALGARPHKWEVPPPACGGRTEVGAPPAAQRRGGEWGNQTGAMRAADCSGPQLEQVDDPLRLLVGGAVRGESQVRILRPLIGAVNAGEVRDFTRTRFGV